MKTFRRHLWPLVAIFLLGLTPLSYFRDRLLIFGGDHGLWILNPGYQIYRDLFLWNTRGIEEFQPYSPLLVPYLLILRFLELLKLPAFTAEAILLSVLFIAAGFSMYFLASSLFGSEKKLLGFAAAIFYMFNSYNIVNWAIPHPVPMASYAFYPLIFAFFVRGLHSKGKPFLDAIIVGLGSLILVTGNFAPSFLLITYFTIFLYFIFYLIFLGAKGERIRALKFTALSAIVIFLFNIWWIVPLVTLSREGAAWFASSTMSLEWSVQNYSKYSSFLHLFQLFGWPGWGTDTFGYDKAYTTNPFLIILSFLPIFLVLTGLILLKSRFVNLSQRNRNIFLFFVGFYLLAMFLSKGIQPPLETLNWWLYKFVPGFAIFRTVSVKLGIMMTLSMAILFSVSLTIVHQRLRKKWLTGMIVALILIYNYPFFTGAAILAKKSFYDSTVHHKLPQYYLDTADWINQQVDDFKILPLPAQGNWEIYKWDDDERYIGVDVFNELSNKTVKHAYTSGDLIKTDIYNAFRQQTAQNVDKILGFLNIKYLLLQKNSDPAVFGTLTPNYIEKQIMSLENVYLEKNFGPLNFYRLDDKYFLPHIYVPKTTTYVVNENLNITPFASFDDFTVLNEVYFANDVRVADKKLEILDRTKNIYISAELANSELLIQDNFNSEVIFPYVRLTPDHILYPYISWKERRAEGEVTDKADKLDALIDLKLLYASKRVVETEKLLDKGNLDFMEKTLGRYEEQVNEIVATVKKGEQKERLPSGILAKVVAYAEKQKERLKSLRHRLPTNLQERINRTIKVIDNAESTLLGKTSTEDPKASRVYYKFVIPKAGKYAIYLEGKNLDKYWQFEGERLTGELRASFEKIEQLSANIKERDKTWILLTEMTFNEGAYQLYFDDFKAKSLFSNRSARVASTPTNLGVTNLQLPNLEPNGVYKISFDYRNELGSPPRFVVWQVEDEDFTRKEIEKAIMETLNSQFVTSSIGNKSKTLQVVLGPQEKFKKDYSWQSYEVIFEPRPQSNSFGIAFFADPASDPTNKAAITVNLYDNLNVEKVFTNKVVLKSQKNDSNSMLPNIVFTKINPIKYKVEVINASDPYTLIFTEAFHAGWKAYLLENKKQTAESAPWETWLKKPLPEKNHYLVNGYANAWRIEKQGDYEIILEFWPQRLFYIGLFIAGLTLTLALCYLTYEKIKSLS